MKKTRIKLPLILKPSHYSILVFIIILLWVFFDTIRQSEGVLNTLILIISILTIINGVINILFEKIVEMDFYELKLREEILAASNAKNYVPYFSF